MGKRILKETIDGVDKYLVWSSIVDAPVTYALTKGEVYDYFMSVAIRTERELLDRMFERGDFGAVADEVACNRAGEDETKISRAQIIDYYFVRQGEGKQPKGRK